jgi:hypothetical protein
MGIGSQMHLPKGCPLRRYLMNPSFPNTGPKDEPVGALIALKLTHTRG